MLELFATLEIKAEKKDLHFDLTAPKSLIEQVSENDRKDPNSPRNRMRQARAAEREKAAKGEATGDEKKSESEGSDEEKADEKKDDAVADKEEPKEDAEAEEK